MPQEMRMKVYLVVVKRHGQLRVVIGVTVQVDVTEDIVAVTELGHAEGASVDHGVVPSSGDACTSVLFNDQDMKIVENGMTESEFPI